MSSKRPSIQSVAPSVTGWPSFGVFGSQFWGYGVMGELDGRELRQSKTHPRIPNTSQYKAFWALSAALWPELQCQIMTAQFDPSFGS